MPLTLNPPCCYLLTDRANPGAAGTARKTVPGQLRGGLFLYGLVYITSGCGEPTLGSVFSVTFTFLYIIWISNMGCVYSENVFFNLFMSIFAVSATFRVTMTRDCSSCRARAVTNVCPLVNLLDYFYQKLRAGQVLQALLCATTLKQLSSVPCFKKRARESRTIL